LILLIVNAETKLPHGTIPTMLSPQSTVRTSILKIHLKAIKITDLLGFSLNLRSHFPDQFISK